MTALTHLDQPDPFARRARTRLIGLAAAMMGMLLTAVATANAA